jgi:hypothetical protein
VNSLVEWYRPGRHETAGSGAARTVGPAGTAEAGELADAVCAVAFDGLRVRRTEGAASVPAGPKAKVAAR